VTNRPSSSSSPAPTPDGDVAIMMVRPGNREGLRLLPGWRTEGHRRGDRRGLGPRSNGSRNRSPFSVSWWPRSACVTRCPTRQSSTTRRGSEKVSEIRPARRSRQMR
jgi:hypothetical protein